MDTELKYDTPEKRRKIAMRETEGQSLAKAAGYVEALRYDAAPLELRLADQDKLIGELVEALDKFERITALAHDRFEGLEGQGQRDDAVAIKGLRAMNKKITSLLSRIRTKAGNNKNSDGKEG